MKSDGQMIAEAIEEHAISNGASEVRQGLEKIASEIPAE